MADGVRHRYNTNDSASATMFRTTVRKFFQFVGKVTPEQLDADAGPQFGDAVRRATQKLATENPQITKVAIKYRFLQGILAVRQLTLFAGAPFHINRPQIRRTRRRSLPYAASRQAAGMFARHTSRRMARILLSLGNTRIGRSLGERHKTRLTSQC